MLERLSITLVQLLLAEDIIQPDDEAVYVYSVEMLLSYVLTYGLIVFLALWLGWLAETLAFYSGFLLLRHSAGGYHASNHWACTALTLATYGASMVFLQIFPPRWQLMVMFALMVISGKIVYDFAPVDHENKPFSPKERQTYRQRSLRAVCLISITSIVLSLGLAPAELTMAAMLGVSNAATSVMIGREVRKNAQKDHDLSR